MSNITREEAIEEIKRWTPILLNSGQCTEKTSEAQDMAISALSENTGEWISTEDRPNGFCSKCDHDIDEASTPYCPYCGAKMTWVGAVHKPKLGNSMLVGKPSLLNQIIPIGEKRKT